ncbi:hypothetical protein SAMN02910370_02720 [Lachnospiraceae bacterium XPB1003]|nr:hypothetical protein SAMN02910370_02720 [Lachnospiraceae bacterium XPB1003]
MRLEQLTCPSCGASIQLDLNGKKMFFCPYCGNQFAVDNGDRVYTKNINIHKRYTNDADVEKWIVKDRENEREHKLEKGIWIGIAVFLAYYFISTGVLIWKDDDEEKESINAGMIQVGQSYNDLEGKKYQAVEAILDSAGFTNITTIDLDDAGWFKNKADTVESVTIGGDSYFSSSDYFYPDEKIIISYH